MATGSVISQSADDEKNDSTTETTARRETPRPGPRRVTTKPPSRVQGQGLRSGPGTRDQNLRSGPGSEESLGLILIHEGVMTSGGRGL